MTEKDDIQAQLEALKANQPLLIALIKDIMRESISIDVKVDSSSERDNFYISMSASLSIDDDCVSESSDSVNVS
jgi:hypothetical protein